MAFEVFIFILLWKIWISVFWKSQQWNKYNLSATLGPTIELLIKQAFQQSGSSDSSGCSYYSNVKRYVVPWLRGMTVGRMRDLALADTLATLRWQRRLNHCHCECELCTWKILLWALFKSWMWNVRNSYLLLLNDLIMWKLWALAHLFVFYLEFDVELLLAWLVTESPCYMILNNSLQHLGINNYRLSMIIHKIITSWH